MAIVHLAVPATAARAAWEWMNETGEHHGTELMALYTVLDEHPYIGACADCSHGSGRHESTQLGGCDLCRCSGWVDPQD